MDEIIASLQRDCSREGANLYRHICDLIAKCSTTEEALEKFEELSIELKHSRNRTPGGPEKKKKLNDNPFLEIEKQKVRNLTVGFVNGGGWLEEDFLEEALTLQAVGLGFSQQETYLISLKMKEISTKGEVETIRFWGKILGTGADYYVYEAILSGDGLSADGAEARGTGCNHYTYFVQNEVCGDLTQLPDVSPEEIKASRLISKMFTGDINSDVLACPWFSGKEMHLLRAQIARISAATTLAVKDSFVINDETGKLQKAEEVVRPAPEELLAQGSWVHVVPYILPNGSTSYPNPEDLEDEAKAELEAEMAEAPVVPLLTPIQEDLEKDEEGNSMAWRIRQYGDKSTYKYGEITRQYTVTVAQSQRWPGAYTVSQGTKCYNFYVGYGVKGDFQPIILPYMGAFQLAPDAVMTEPTDFAEQPEPNPVRDDEEASDGGDEDQPADGEA